MSCAPSSIATTAWIEKRTECHSVLRGDDGFGLDDAQT
jgi:hypothetical protein